MGSVDTKLGDKIPGSQINGST